MTEGRAPKDARNAFGGRPADPWALLEDAATVLVAHAHPDDETLSTGPLIAHLAASGVRVVLATATRGEEGETIPGSRPDGDARTFEEVRMTELDGASRALGVAERHMLGTPPALAAGSAPRVYRDSGMQWIAEDVAGPADDTGPDAFTRLPLEDAAQDLAALAASVGADALVSYDEGGTYGHPDHVHVHHVAARAAEIAGLPLVEAADYIGDEAPSEEVTDARGFAWRGTPDALDAVARALGAHQTQLTVTGSSAAPAPGAVTLRLSGGQDRVVPMTTGLRRHRS